MWRQRSITRFKHWNFKSLKMKEYKIIKSEFHWTKNLQKFEELINKEARNSWKVVGFSNLNGGESQFVALLERDKNR